MINFFITLGIFLLSFNTFRFLLGNYIVFKNKDVHPLTKIINLIESIAINATLVFLIYFYILHK